MSVFVRKSMPAQNTGDCRLKTCRSLKAPVFPNGCPASMTVSGAAFVSVRDYRAGELHDADGHGQLRDADRGVQSACGITVPGWHDYSDVHGY